MLNMIFFACVVMIRFTVHYGLVVTLKTLPRAYPHNFPSRDIKQRIITLFILSLWSKCKCDPLYPKLLFQEFISVFKLTRTF